MGSVFIYMNNFRYGITVRKVCHLPELDWVKRVTVPELYIIVSDVDHLVFDIILYVITRAGGERMFIGLQHIQNFSSEFFF